MFKRFDWETKSGKGSSGLEDMVLLSKISDDAIVDNIKKRYNDDLIYTYIGPILIAVNPFKSLPYFTDKELEVYCGCTPHEVPPHIYALTDHMYREMMLEGENQCVIISGESGAGKTVSAKYIMNYIASVAPRAPELDNVKEIILESNPLLEAFGNAKTLRNNNSSRFGKYFQIEFTRGGVPDGGKISNFLLEKSRVTYQQQGERNFHIFYQLTKGASPQEKEALGITTPDYFQFINMSGTFDADGQDDPKDYKDTRHAMNVCGISPEDQNNLIMLVAGILHLGNVQFVEQGNNAKVYDPATLEFPAYLFGIQPAALNTKLVSRQMTTGGAGGRTSTYEVPLNPDQAAYTRNALAKSIYSRMFDWIVEAINKRLRKDTESMCLGVLDIYGFEIFDRNGFEQFCINYVNEKLQQIFIELTLRAEQDEYASEGIQWTPIDFFNNKIVCDLIESKRPVGVMAVLDDICAQMHAQSDGADSKLMIKLNQTISGNAHFNGTNATFTIKHYAGPVAYDANGFCEANRDTLYKDLIQLMQTTTNSFIRALFPEDTMADDKKRPTTAAFKIKSQANVLVETLMKCTPHYIRCIKPNETKRPKDWDNSHVSHQVRYLNLKENIRIRRAGYAYRQLFEKFLRRFAILTPETFPHWNGPVQQGIQHIMRTVEMDPSQFQMGRTKIFIKSPESLFMLEELRGRKYHTFAVRIQRTYRSWKARKYFLELKAKSQDVFYNRKERKRISLKREYIGDYIGFLDNPSLRSLVDKKERIIFADNIIKYERRYKPQPRVLLLGEKTLYLVALEKIKEGPNKGRIMHVVKRQLPLSAISAISVSTLADDLFIVHVPSEYDNVFESVFKTELIIAIIEKSKQHFGREPQVNFSDAIQYTIKKGKQVVKFVPDSMVKMPTMKSGTMRVPPGLPRDSRNMQSAASTARSAAPSRGAAPARGAAPTRGPAPTAGRPAPQPAAAYQQAPPQAAPAQPPAAAPGPARPPMMGGRPPMMGAGGAARPPMGAAPPMGGARPMGAAPPMGAGARPMGAPAGGAPAGAPMGARPPPAGVGASGKRPVPPPTAKPKLPTCKALYPYDATEADELSVKAGDIITITKKDDSGWWEGTTGGRKGLFPSNYVELIN